MKPVKQKKHLIISERHTRTVTILEDSNGQPWTWVVGEHPNDIPFEKMWEKLGYVINFFQNYYGKAKLFC